ncbi:Glycosyl transferases group 1 [Rubripirellula amarantea]|uniref:tRNA-queuosine alpha-mannosyltransferase n=1 Tax=Rubripirellula amarantea TaxID=2527999 RepID=A0A5C5WX90_9BACT|nr:DUF3524 domain-containing protein [Rubripirellula amarantea]TWT54505.1 Glycosyl transferases group 1 [Rubripirellula amarantea]
MSGRRVLAIDPFHGGSHLAFLEGVVGSSRHAWTVIADKPVHWKWRMRASALKLAQLAQDEVNARGKPELIFCTDMLDVPAWLGMMRKTDLSDVPVVIYFHENQWTYPTSLRSRVDFHFGYTNLMSAFAADHCVFNSAYHRDDFLNASKKFVASMPDSHEAHPWKMLNDKCCVIYPGFDVGSSAPIRSADFSANSIVLGWVSRWESDKRPDEFLRLCRMLDERGIDFQLVLLGPQPNEQLTESLELRRNFANRIIHDGYARTRQEYLTWLSRIDIVVSTADHEFFGIAICEAIASGAIPVVPDRLSYLELVPKSQRYDTIENACLQIQEIANTPSRDREPIFQECLNKIQPMHLSQSVMEIDLLIERLVSTD